MNFEGFVIHHSACSSINGHGYDFWIARDASVVAAPQLMDASYIHICLEGDFGTSYSCMTREQKQQLFSASKLIMELSIQYNISPLYLNAHDESCPGEDFPWNELVIYPVDGYH